MVPKAAVVISKDWKSDFLSFVSERLEQIEKDYPMESMDDISYCLFHREHYPFLHDNL
jgi:hypothetical protein